MFYCPTGQFSCKLFLGL